MWPGNSKELPRYNPAKIYNALLGNRIEPKIDKILQKNQNSFRRNRSTTSQILTIPRILQGVYNIIRWFLPCIWLHTQREDGANTSRQRPSQRNRRSHSDGLQKHKCIGPLTGWRQRLLRRCNMCATRRHITQHLFIICQDYVLKTSMDLMKENSFKLAKERSRRYPAQQLPTQTTPMTWHF